MVRCLALVIFFVAGCAALTKQTPEQELVHERFRVCRQHTGMAMGPKFISADGRRFFIEGGEAAEQAMMKRCLSERFGYRWAD